MNERRNKTIYNRKFQYCLDNVSKIWFCKYQPCTIAEWVIIYLDSRVSIHTLLTFRTFFTLLNKFTKLNWVETSRPPSIFGIMIKYTVFVVMCHSYTTRNTFKVVQIEMLDRDWNTLISLCLLDLWFLWEVCVILVIDSLLSSSLMFLLDFNAELDYFSEECLCIYAL